MRKRQRREPAREKSSVSYRWDGFVCFEWSCSYLVVMLYRQGLLDVSGGLFHVKMREVEAHRSHTNVASTMDGVSQTTKKEMPSSTVIPLTWTTSVTITTLLRWRLMVLLLD